MNALSQETTVNLYLDFISFALMAGLLCLSTRLRTKKTDAELFTGLCISTMAAGVFGMIIAVHDELPFAWRDTSLLILTALFELVILYVPYQLVLFTGYKLYGSRDHLKRRYYHFFIPVVLFSVLLLINLFTGILYTLDQDLNPKLQPLYYVMAAFEIICVLSTAFIVGSYRRKHGTHFFFHILPMMIPLATGYLVSRFTPYATGVLGIAIGLTNLYFSMMNEWKYEDDETGFFNAEYLERIAELTEAGVYDYKGAVIVETTGDAAAVASLLHDEMPAKAEIVVTEPGRFALLSEHTDKGLLALISQTITDAADEAELPVKTLVRKRAQDEDPVSFVRGLA